MKKHTTFQLILIVLVSIFITNSTYAQTNEKKVLTAYLVKYDNSNNNISFSELENRVLTRNVFFYIAKVSGGNEVIILSDKNNQISHQDLKSIFNTDIKILETRQLNNSQFNFSTIPYYKESIKYSKYLERMNTWRNQNISVPQKLKTLLK